MAALPVSPDSLYNIASFASEVRQSCRASKGQFDKIGREAFALKTAVELVAIELENKQLPVNALDEDPRIKKYYRQLGIHIGNCQQALQTAQNYVRKHEKTAAWQQLRWGRSGKDDVDNVVADLASFATQLDSFVGSLNLKSIGKMLGRIGRLEQSLDRNGGNEGEAVAEIMVDLRDLGLPTQAVEKYKNVLASYAQELNQQTKECMSPTKKKDRKKSDSPVTVATNIRLKERSQSADTIQSINTMNIQRSQSATPSTKTLLTTTTTATTTSTSTTTIGTPKPLLECYLIQIKSNNFSFLTWQKSGKELQPRGQRQLEEMSQTFLRAASSSSSSSSTSPTSSSKSPTKAPTDEYDLVGWVVEDRQKTESDPATHEWKPYASRIERKPPPSPNPNITSGANPPPLLDAGVEEQALVIIHRGLTPTATLQAATATKAALAVAESARKLAKTTAAEQKRQAKLAHAQRKSSDAAAEKASREQREQGKRRAEMRHLTQQVALLGLNQQPTLADKPAAVEEKKRLEREARRRREGEKRREMRERGDNLGKVELALFPQGVPQGNAPGRKVDKGKGREVEMDREWEREKEREREREDERWLGGSPRLLQGEYPSPSAAAAWGGWCRDEGRIQAVP